MTGTCVGFNFRVALITRFIECITIADELISSLSNGSIADALLNRVLFIDWRELNAAQEITSSLQSSSLIDFVHCRSQFSVYFNGLGILSTSQFVHQFTVDNGTASACSKNRFFPKQLLSVNPHCAVDRGVVSVKFRFRGKHNLLKLMLDCGRCCRLQRW